MVEYDVTSLLCLPEGTIEDLLLFLFIDYDEEKCAIGRKAISKIFCEIFLLGGWRTSSPSLKSWKMGVGPNEK
jgi:hypothetical protein